MVSLDSPLLTLGALWFAGNRRRSLTGGETGKGLVAGGFGGASAEWAAGQVRNVAGVEESAVSDELLQALVGAGVSRFGDPIPANNAIARGIHYNVATQAIQDAGMSAGDLFGGITGGGGTSSSMSQPQSAPSSGAQAIHNRRRHNGDTVSY